jgi:hypothetical protein
MDGFLSTVDQSTFSPYFDDKGIQSTSFHHLATTRVPLFSLILIQLKLFIQYKH